MTIAIWASFLSLNHYKFGIIIFCFFFAMRNPHKTDLKLMIRKISLVSKEKRKFKRFNQMEACLESSLYNHRQ